MSLLKLQPWRQLDSVSGLNLQPDHSWDFIFPSEAFLSLASSFLCLLPILLFVSEPFSMWSNVAQEDNTQLKLNIESYTAAFPAIEEK